MKKASFLQIMLISCYILSIGCYQEVKTEPYLDIGVPEKEMNTRFHIEAPAGWNNFIIGQTIGILVEVISGDQVSFPSNYGARIFILNKDEWKEVPNTMEYPQVNMTLGPSNGDPKKTLGTAVHPDLTNINTTVKLRIILIGNIMKDGKVTDQKTAGYVDVTLKPK